MNPAAETGSGESATTRALRIHTRNDLRLERVYLPSPRADEVIVRVSYGGVCGSDVHYWHDGAVGTSVLRAPMILGHEVVGTIAAPAGDGSGLPADQPVAIHPARNCGSCRWCVGGQPNLCPDCRYLGSAARWPHTDGGFADYLVMPASRLIPLPGGLGLRRAALAEPTGVAWHAVSRARAVGARVDGANVLVVGAGPIGLLLIAVSIYRGAATVTAIDVHERPLHVAAAVGATNSLTVREFVASQAPPSADIVYESSGTPAGLETAVRSARPGGVVVAVGQQPGDAVPWPAGLLTAKELTVTGSLRLDAELPAALAFLADPNVNVDAVITDVFPVGDAEEAFATAADAAKSSKVLLDFS
jgi:L-idonate 5-dehydrogenase